MKNKWRCPSCKKMVSGFPAISRKDNKTKICSNCGTIEAVKNYIAITSEKHGKFTCVVCGKKFDDGWSHVLRGVDMKGNDTPDSQGLQLPIDEAHSEYLRKIEDAGSDERGYCPIPCFCGGTVVTIGGGSPDGDAWWSTDCNQCGFLFDED